MRIGTGCPAGAGGTGLVCGWRRLWAGAVAVEVTGAVVCVGAGAWPLADSERATSVPTAARQPSTAVARLTAATRRVVLLVTPPLIPRTGIEPCRAAKCT